CHLCSAFTGTQRFDSRHQMSLTFELKDALEGSETSPTPTPTPAASLSTAVKPMQGGAFWLFFAHVVSDWKTQQTAAARSVTVVLSNGTEYALARRASTIPHGIWSRFPPELVNAGETTDFGVRGQNDLAGAQATASYDVVGQGVVL